MCGLSGAMSSTLSWNEETIFRDLLSISSLRGSDGSGVIVSNKQALRAPIIRSFKTTGISGALANSQQLQELLKPSTNIVIGHARWPTKGGTDIKAVHPHRTDHIIGVHNGTMYRVNGEEVKDQSDSEMLFKSIAAVGVEQTLKESSGAYALVWIDEREQTLNFLRNDARSLWFMNTGWQKNINTLFWSSEKEMLEFVFARSYKGNNTWATYLPPHTWFQYPLDVRHIIVPQNVVKDVKPKAVTYAMTPWRGQGARGRFDTSGTGVCGFDDDLPFTAEATHNQGLLRLPPPGGSKQAQKRFAKAVAKEVRDLAKARERFHKKHGQTANSSYVPADSTRPGSAILNDDISDIGVGPHSVHFAGQPCSWCGSHAEAGDYIYLGHHSDLGDKSFLCMDCARNPDCTPFIENITPSAVI